MYDVTTGLHRPQAFLPTTKDAWQPLLSSRPGGWKVDPDGGSLTKPGMKLGEANVPFGWDPINIGRGRKTEAERAASLQSELKNGRLAMVGIASLYVATSPL